MKILFLARYLPQHGSTIHMYDLAKFLMNKGHNVIIISSGPGYDSSANQIFEDIKKYGVETYNVAFPLNPEFGLFGKMKQLVQYIFVTPKVLCRLIRLDPDIIHVHYPVTSYLAWIYCKLKRKKFITTHHISGIPKHILHKKADHTIAISKELQFELINTYNYKEENVSLIYNGVSKEKFNIFTIEDEKKIIKNSARVPQDKVVVGFVGSLIRRKGIDILLEAVSLLKTNNVHVILLGDGDNEWIIELINEFKLEDRVTIYPFGDPIEYYKIFDIFVLPSRVEGFPLVVIEAMMMGIPVIRSNTEGAYDQILHMKDGFIFKNEDSKELSEYIDMLVKDEKLRSSIGENARYKALNNFTLDIMGEKTSNLYNEIIES